MIARYRDAWADGFFRGWPERGDGFFRFGKAPLVGVENREVVQHRSDVGVIRPQLFFINFERVKVVRLRRFLPAGFSVNEREVV